MGSLIRMTRAVKGTTIKAIAMSNLGSVQNCL